MEASTLRFSSVFLEVPLGYFSGCGCKLKTYNKRLGPAYEIVAIG